MNYNKKSVLDADVKGKKVLLRCDFNVPQNKETGVITSDKRIVAALPTIKYLLENGAAVIACSHLGKPKGEWKPKLTLAPVADRLSELLGQKVVFANDIIGEDAKAKAAALKPGEIMLLENLRFDIREEKNGADFAKALADMAELYVSDAFGTVHRAHASTAGVAAYLPAYAGLLVEKELSVMGKALNDPKRPFVAVLGGAKVSDKIGVINNLLEKADTVIIGGGMAYTFIKAMGYEIGNSLLGEHLPHNVAVRAAIDHLHIRVLPEGLHDLANHLFRAGINTGTEYMHHFHRQFSPCCDSSRAASPIFRLRIP